MQIYYEAFLFSIITLLLFILDFAFTLFATKLIDGKLEKVYISHSSLNTKPFYSIKIRGTFFNVSFPPITMFFVLFGFNSFSEDEEKTEDEKTIQYHTLSENKESQRFVNKSILQKMFFIYFKKICFLTILIFIFFIYPSVQQFQISLLKNFYFKDSIPNLTAIFEKSNNHLMLYFMCLLTFDLMAFGFGKDFVFDILGIKNRLSKFLIFTLTILMELLPALFLLRLLYFKFSVSTIGFLLVWVLSLSMILLILVTVLRIIFPQKGLNLNNEEPKP